MDGSDLKALCKDLASAASSGKPQEVIGVLTRLKKINATEESLRETKAGVAVGKLRTHNSKEVSDLAKDIVKKWKADVDRAKKPLSDGTKGKPRNNSVTSQSNTASPSTPTPSLPATPISAKSPPSHTSATPTNAAKSGIPRNAKTDNVKFEPLGVVRDATRKLVYDSLAIDSGAPTNQILEKANAIEEAVYREFKTELGQPYKNKMRSLALNLKEKSNPGLREGVVSGTLPVARFCNMTANEMASEERRQTNEIIAQQNLFKTLAAGEPEAETDAFQCGRCKQRKTRYRQAQTRSADEPMTTFVTCVNCNNRWKFS